MNIQLFKPGEPNRYINLAAVMPDGKTSQMDGYEKGIVSCIPSKTFFQEIIESAKRKLERSDRSDIDRASIIL